jgi:predicted ribosome quality control (RQC) complex YloA/Tae2 family protein
MKKILVVFLGLILIGSVVLPVFAQTSTSTTTSTTPTSTQQLVDYLKSLIENLQKQILELQAKIQAMRQAQNQVREQAQNIQDTLKDIRDLRKGMTSEEIKAIQQILASDPDIYPEGVISGYYGPLTEKALNRFREKYGIKEEDKRGKIGPKTLEKLSELLEKNRVIKLEDGRKCVIVPPGHLVAPGLMKKSTTRYRKIIKVKSWWLDSSDIDTNKYSKSNFYSKHHNHDFNRYINRKYNYNFNCYFNKFDKHKPIIIFEFIN